MGVAAGPGQPGLDLIELFTYRASAHSTSDDPNRYRPAGESEGWPLGDPVERLKTHLIRLGEWSEADHAALEAELIEEVRKAGREAEKIGVLGASRAPIEEMFNDVYKEQPWHLKRQAAELAAEAPDASAFTPQTRALES